MPVSGSGVLYRQALSPNTSATTLFACSCFCNQTNGQHQVFTRNEKWATEFKKTGMGLSKLSNMRTSVKQWTLAFSKLVLHITIPRHHHSNHHNVRKTHYKLHCDPSSQQIDPFFASFLCILLPGLPKRQSSSVAHFIVNPSGSQYCKHLEKVVDNHQF